MSRILLLLLFLLLLWSIAARSRPERPAADGSFTLHPIAVLQPAPVPTQQGIGFDGAASRVGVGPTPTR